MATETIEAGGAVIPRLGFGTWQLSGRTAREAVATALEVGYRHIDTAAMYGNEAEVGAAIAASGLPRDDIFITTKVWRSELREAALLRSAEASLRKLGVDEVDLLLIHWPTQDVPLAEQIRGLCRAKQQGFTRHIGVSNFPVALLRSAIDLATEPIATDQVEHHPDHRQDSLLAFCQGNGVAFTSYSPLGRGQSLAAPVIRRLAAEKNKTPAQIVLRWHLQLPGNIAIPRSSQPDRIRENFDVSDFVLSDAEMASVSAPPQARRI